MFRSDQQMHANKRHKGTRSVAENRTYNLPKQQDVLASYKVDPPRYIGIKVSGIESFDRIL